MSGHVPKFGGSNAGNFTEVFTLARGGGKAGSGDSAASSQPEESGNGPVYSGRGGGSGGGRGGAAAAAPARRESGSTRSSQEGSNRPSPPGRREPREPREPREQSTRTGVRGSHEKGNRHRNDEYAGASHLPKFGEWNAGEGDTNYTVMFTAASKERKTGVAVDDTPMKGSGDPQSNSSRIPKKQSSCWSCF